MSDRFEKLIEARLAAELGPLVRSARAPQRSIAGSRRSAAMLTTRTVVMAMAVALAVGGGFIAATAATGSASPAEWTLQVKAVVTQCRTTMAPGERGIGHCVSDNVEANPSPTPTAVPTQVAQPPVHPAVAADPRAEPALVRPATSTSRPAESDIEVDDHGGHSRPGTPSPPPDD